MAEISSLISVVIPVKNGEDTLGNLLEALNAQDILPKEIVIIDDGSTDRTVEIVQASCL